MSTLRERVELVLPEEQTAYPGPLGLGARWTDDDGAVCALWARRERAVAVNELRGQLWVASHFETESTHTLTLRGIKEIVRSARRAVTDGVPPDGELYDLLTGIGDVVIHGAGHNKSWPLDYQWFESRWSDCHTTYQDAMRSMQ